MYLFSELLFYAIAAWSTLVAWLPRGEDLERFPYAVVGLLALCVAAVLRHRRRDPLWLADACVLVTLSLFGIAYGISNVMFLVSEDFFERMADTGAMADTTLLATLGCFCMWRGRNSKLFSEMTSPKTEDDVRLSKVWCLILFAISVSSILIQVQLGLFGYALEQDAAKAFVGYRYALTLLGELGFAVLVALALVHFSLATKRRQRTWLFVVTAVMVMVGFLSGFKAQVVTPLLFLAICYYIKKRRIPVAILSGGVAALILAYVVIQPFRAARYEAVDFDASSVTSIASALLSPTERELEFTIIGMEIVSRLNLTAVGSAGIAYVREGRVHPGEDPEFAERLLLAPLYAGVPRVIWEGRPQATVGGWYTQRVLGRPEDTETSVGMGPVTYFNFCGGALAVALGFFTMGMIYRAVRLLLVPSSNGRLLVYVLILPSLVWIEAGQMDSVLIHLTRTILIYLVLQYLLFSAVARPSRRMLSGAI